MTTRKKTHQKRAPIRHPIPSKTKPEPRRVFFYGRVARVDKPVDVNNTSRNTATNTKSLSATGNRTIAGEHKDVHNNIAQPTAVIFLRARHLGPNGPDREREQRMIASQRAACERSANELGAHIIGEYVEYGGTGSIDTRVVIRRMLDELHARRDTTYLIVTRKDRLAWQPHDRFRLAQEIHAAGVKLVTTDHSHLLPDG